MRAHVAASILLATLAAACAPPPSPAYAPSRFDAGALRAHLMPVAGGSVSFHVDRPAYVTVFEIDPVYGVQMLYPRFQGEAMASRAGVHTMWRSSARYASAGWHGMGWYPASFVQRSAHMIQPRVFYLIASERPLRVEPYIGSSLSLRAAMGGLMYGSTQTVMDGLARLVVSNYAGGDWVTDVYMEWPQPAYDAVQPMPTHVIQCDGRRYVVPFYVTTCPIDRVAPPVRDSTVVTDNGTPRQPERRRPERPGVREERGGRAGTGVADGVTRPEGPVQPERGARPERVREPAATRGVEPETRVPQRGEARPQPRDEARPTRPEPPREREPRPVPAERPREMPRPTEPERPSPPRAQPQVDRTPPREMPPVPRADPPAPRAEPPAPRPEPPAPRAEPPAPRPEPPAPRAEPPAPRPEPPAPRAEPPAPRPVPEPLRDS